MPVFQLDKTLIFPDPELADNSGILAVGGDLSADRILLAYRMGIFPWYNDDEPIIWWSPIHRMVLYPKQIKISKSMRQVLGKEQFRVTLDKDFERVIKKCQRQPRKEQNGTWITDEMMEAYIDLHKKGYAHSIEVWLEEKLVGGLYGISLGSLFFGESMFSKVSNASKTGFIFLSKTLERLGFTMIDCQLYTKHLASLGAKEIVRKNYLEELIEGLKKPTLQGNWNQLKEFDLMYKVMRIKSG